MATARMRQNRLELVQQTRLIESLFSEEAEAEVDVTHFVETGLFGKPQRKGPRLPPEVWAKVAEIEANGGHCIVNLPTQKVE